MPKAWFDDGEPLVERSTEKELLPEGWHECKVYSVDDTDLDIGIVFKPTSGNYWWPKQKFSKSTQREYAVNLGKRILDRFGIPSERWDDVIAGGDLIDRIVEVRIYHKEKNGTTYANVADFRVPEPEAAPPAAPPERKSAARTNSQKVQQSKGEDAAPLDDIPFLWLLPLALAAAAMGGVA